MVPSEGGQPRRIRGDFGRASHPVWSPDARHILFRAEQGSDRPGIDWWITSINDDDVPPVRTRLADTLREQGFSQSPGLAGAGGGFPSRADGGSYLIATAPSGDSLNIWKAPISLRDLQMSGPARQVTFGTEGVASPSIAPGAGGDLRLVFASLRGNADIWSLPLDADRATVTGPLVRITDQESSETRSSVSEDGRKLVYGSNRGRFAEGLEEGPGQRRRISGVPRRHE